VSDAHRGYGDPLDLKQLSRAAYALGREDASNFYKRQVEQLTVAGIHTCHDECQRVACVLRREVEKLKADNAALRRDAERYRWICRFPEDADYEVTHALNGYGWSGNGPSFRDLLSDAIDAALAAKGKK
jgi:hypothetical protein